MNKENAVRFLPLVKALALGETIQVRAAGRNNKTDWRDMDSVNFSRNDPADYRIKPKERFVVVGETTMWIGGAIYDSRKVADDVLSRTTRSDGPFKVYQLVEVPAA